MDHLSPHKFADAVGKACKSKDGTIEAVENTLATPYYEANFEFRRMKADFDGITECREIMSASNDNDGVVVYYKVFKSCFI